MLGTQRWLVELGHLAKRSNSVRGLLCDRLAPIVSPFVASIRTHPGGPSSHRFHVIQALSSLSAILDVPIVRRCANIGCDQVDSAASLADAVLVDASTVKLSVCAGCRLLYVCVVLSPSRSQRSADGVAAAAQPVRRCASSCGPLCITLMASSSWPMHRLSCRFLAHFPPAETTSPTRAN